MAVIIMGDERFDGEGRYLAGSTIVTKNNSALLSGIITSVKVWYSDTADATNFRVGTFRIVAGDTLKCISSTSDLGTITKASLQTITGLILSVAAGDYLGCYSTAGRLRYNDGGGGGGWFASGESIDVNDQANYGVNGVNKVALQGIGTTVSKRGWMSKWQLF